MKNNKNKKNTFVLYSLISLITAFAVCALFFFYELSAIDLPENAKEVRFEIPAGISVSEISNSLYEKNLIRSPKAFYLAARFPFLSLRKTSPVIKSGVYSLKTSMNVFEIFTLFESGQQEFIKTVIPEGLTIRKIARILETEGVCSAEDFITAAQNPDLIQKYSIPFETFEGFLFPDTYFFAPSMNAENVLLIMIENFFKKISIIPEFADKSVPDFYEKLILASIVEREYRVADEAPLIASVFTNRINAGAGLYSCATIEYIITEIQGRPHPDVITYDDLKIDSPYNTYKWAALPPGPISNPGLIALKAAANPPETNYFYFTLTDSDAGSHTFSESFNAHIKAGTQFKTKKS
ncbi:endolytic transglycosylase MltG [Treponema sp.]|uniref:endolytic transglycosylase MltG n=1 Tax=Treponema sp. TaxID=166 RepID=UPI00388FF49A